MFELERIDELVVSWTAGKANASAVERTYECNGEVCGTSNERRPCEVLVAVKFKNIDVCASGRIAPRGIESRAGDSHHSQPAYTLYYLS